MAQMAAGIQEVKPTRTKALIVPREHGAWGLLLVPLVSGACVGLLRGHGLGDLMLFVTAALALFWARTPLEILLGSSVMHTHSAQEKRVVWQAAVVATLCAALPLYALLRNGRHMGLLFIAAVAGAAFATQACVKLFGRRWRMPAQIIGAIGLTSTAAGAYYLVTDRFGVTAIALWFLNWLFAGDQIHYVHVRMHSAKLMDSGEKISRAWVFLLGQLAMLVVVALLGAFHFIPMLAILAFVPVTARGVAWVFGHKAKLDLPWLGITELLQSITFAMLLITSFYWPR